MDNKFSLLISQRVMQLLAERLKEDLWYSQERRDAFEEGGMLYKVYQNAIDEDEKLIDEIHAILNSIDEQ